MRSRATADGTTRADVVVIGGGIAGLGVARDLARGGVDVVLLEGRDRLGDGASGRDPGVFTAGLTESAWRLAHAIGGTRTGELYALAGASRAALPAGVALEEGAAHLAVDAREPGELEASLETLAGLGVEARLLAADEACDWVGGAGFTAGLAVAGDGALDPRRLVEALAAEARALGVRCLTSARADAVVDHAGGLRVRSAVGQVDAEVVVFAAGHALRAVDPWFDDKLTPVREHALRTSPVQGTIRPGRAQLGYATWRQATDRGLVLSGCRWATPHLETGETEEIVLDAVIAKLEAFRRRHLPATSGSPTQATWARITTHACDGLPVLGPLPGDPRRVACVGFGGLQPSLGLACAAGVARGLLTGRSGLPDGLDAGRFVG